MFKFLNESDISTQDIRRLIKEHEESIAFHKSEIEKLKLLLKLQKVGSIKKSLQDIPFNYKGIIIEWAGDRIDYYLKHAAECNARTCLDIIIELIDKITEEYKIKFPFKDITITCTYLYGDYVTYAYFYENKGDEDYQVALTNFYSNAKNSLLYGFTMFDNTDKSAENANNLEEMANMIATRVLE